MHDLEWVDLGNGELIVQLGGRESGRVTQGTKCRADQDPMDLVRAQLGTDWEWDSEEYGVLEEDGTVTEWVTLHGARRKHLTELPSAEVQKMLKELTAA